MTRMTLERSRVIDAPVERVWGVLSDLDGYHSHAPALTHTRVLDSAGEIGAGTRRRCEDTSGSTWEETCTLWEPNSRYVIEVDVSTYPARYRSLFRRFRGIWSVAPTTDGDATVATLTFDVELRRVPGVRLLAERMAARSGADLDSILASYAAAAAVPHVT